MELKDLKEEHYLRLIKAISEIILKKGPSHTSMDYVASTLNMSKRTLYELFGSKDDMIRHVMEYYSQKSKQEVDDIFRSTPNVLEAMHKMTNYLAKIHETASVDFLRDMDDRCKHLRTDYESYQEEMIKPLMKVIHLGIMQGVFRKNIDLDLQIRILFMQLESLKRMEDFFPPEITISQVFIVIGRGFLRNIVSSKGLEMLDQMEATDQ
ncbi:MAG: TetR/AcrR family transcriptional regulator [Lepagella sp.]